ncbi:MAG: hypothetical protein JWO09_765 [Bacteroidetes bacterium]|nr:hypothetical protein [Bacteroidota bacterium]
MKTKLILLLFCAGAYSDAQTSVTPAKQSAQKATGQHAPEVTFAIDTIIVHPAHHIMQNKGSQVAMFGDTIFISVTDASLIEKKRSMNNPIVLYLNRLPFNINGHLAGGKPNDIRFILTRYYEDDENWNKLLRSGFIDKSFYVGVGLEDGSLIAPISYPIEFTLRTPSEAVPFILLSLALGCFTIFMVWKKKLLQDKIEGYYIYSLSSVHLFFWTQIVLLSYMLIWFVCDDMNSIENSNLVLLGISAGTAGISTIINGNDKALKRVRARRSQGFFHDILSDRGEFCMHRYQIFIFNVVVGAFFIYRTISELKMPVLNETILVLLGISSATYTGLKAITSKNLVKADQETSPAASKTDPEQPGANE